MSAEPIKSSLFDDDDADPLVRRLMDMHYGWIEARVVAEVLRTPATVRARTRATMEAIHAQGIEHPHHLYAMHELNNLDIAEDAERKLAVEDLTTTTDRSAA